MAPSSHSYDDDVEEKHNIFHVLAVDDSNIDRKILERLLTLSEYHVTCVDSGDKALEYLGLISNSTHPHQVSSKVNLIMTDYSMPGITGYDLLKKIKDSSWKDVPVIVMSSENVQSRINMCLEGGAEEFLLKPVKLSDLSKLQSHILKYTFTRESDGGSETTMTDIIDSAIEKEEEKISVTTNNDKIISINRDEDKEMMRKITTNNEINNNRDEEEKGENDMNCSNATRKTTFKTILMSSDLSDRRPHVQELPVA